MSRVHLDRDRQYARVSGDQGPSPEIAVLSCFAVWSGLQSRIRNKITICAWEDDARLPVLERWHALRSTNLDHAMPRHVG